MNELSMVAYASQAKSLGLRTQSFNTQPRRLERERADIAAFAAEKLAEVLA